jgi:hypothetical protein
VQEVNTTESPCDNGVNWSTSTLDLHFGIAADMGESVAFTQLNEGKLAVVAVGKEI